MFPKILLPLVFLSFLTSPLRAEIRGKVLVVLSSESQITVLKDRTSKKTGEHPTGFYLSELMVPAHALVKAHYSLVFANPQGNEAVMDASSDDVKYFGHDEARHKELRAECESWGICSAGSNVGKAKLYSLAQIREKGLSGYSALFIPVGHAPMQDLWKDPNLGAILKDFHAKFKPTALICHGPIALLSALGDPEAYAAALEKGDLGGAEKLSRDWIYRGYGMTAFSTVEEQEEEPGGHNKLQGYVRFYPDQALDYAGGKVMVRAAKWRPNVVQSGELITGQNPFSDTMLAETLLRALAAER